MQVFGSNERDLWLACMFTAMQEVGVAADLQESLQKAFFGTADWMRNRAG